MNNINRIIMIITFGMTFSLILSACGDNINSSDAPAEYTMDSTEIDTDNSGNVNEADTESSSLKPVKLVYSQVDKNLIGKKVYQEFAVLSVEKNEIRCCTMDYIDEEYKDYRNIYAICVINDTRELENIIVKPNDVVYIEGIVVDVYPNNGNGLYTPEINATTIKYIRELFHTKEEAVSEEELQKKRLAERDEFEAKINANSNYSGISKNIDNMDILSDDEIMMYSDEVNFRDMENIREEQGDMNHRFVKIHLKISNHKRMQKDERKAEIATAALTNSAICSDYFLSRQFNESIQDYYDGPVIGVYFKEGIKGVEKLHDKDEIVVYGQIINYETEYGAFDILVSIIE